MKPLIKAAGLCRALGLPVQGSNQSFETWINRVPPEQRRKLNGRHFLTPSGVETLRQIAATQQRAAETPIITTDWSKPT